MRPSRTTEPGESLSADGAWTVRYSLQLLDQLESRRYRSRRSRIESRIDELLKDPFRAARSERLRHEFSGLRSARMVEELRLIYRLCQECRQLGEQGRLPLECCLDDSTVDRTINLLCLSDHYADMPLDFDFDA